MSRKRSANHEQKTSAQRKSYKNYIESDYSKDGTNQNFSLKSEDENQSWDDLDTDKRPINIKSRFSNFINSQLVTIIVTIISGLAIWFITSFVGQVSEHSVKINYLEQNVKEINTEIKVLPIIKYKLKLQ